MVFKIYGARTLKDGYVSSFLIVFRFGFSSDLLYLYCFFRNNLRFVKITTYSLLKTLWLVTNDHASYLEHVLEEEIPVLKNQAHKFLCSPSGQMTTMKLTLLPNVSAWNTLDLEKYSTRTQN